MATFRLQEAIKGRLDPDRLKLRRCQDPRCLRERNGFVPRHEPGLQPQPRFTSPKPLREALHGPSVLALQPPKICRQDAHCDIQGEVNFAHGEPYCLGGFPGKLHQDI